MKQIYPLVAFAVLLAAGFFFVSNFQVTTDQRGGPQLRPRENPTTPGGISLPFGLGQQTSSTPTPGWNNQANPQPQANLPVSVPGRQTLGGDMIRVASFNVQVFGEQKISNPEVVKVLADIVRHFDIVAVQEIRDERQSMLPGFVQVLNSPGMRFDYAIGPRLGRTTSKEQYAYIFNTDTIEIDRRTVYTVADPDDLLHREPLVASFRCRRADPSMAFTFTLVNIHTDPTPQTLREELTVLDDVFRQVRNDPRGEDDIIMLGDFNANYQQMGDLSRTQNLAFAITNSSLNKILATNVAGKAQYDNLVFDRTATQEFLGRSGVFDFLREYNLSQAQAKQVSDHLPVWAEFSVYEGGIPGRVASARPSRYSQPPQTAPYDERYTQQPGYRQPSYQQPNYPPASRYTDNYAPGYSDEQYAPREEFDPYQARPNDGRDYDDRYAPQYTADPRYPGDYNSGSQYPPPRSYLPPRQGRR